MQFVADLVSPQPAKSQGKGSVPLPPIARVRKFNQPKPKKRGFGLLPTCSPVCSMPKVTVVGSKQREAVSYTHLRAHETVLDLVCRLLLEKKKTTTTVSQYISTY
eukprot:TRINITY_DN19931_c0_g1_i1.p1 TRINITY_DN19931_c0_g1~~TRINITY_DN19931_c0_g1_i1.p1  ORF type:complete len:105 (+),score=33.75 TRINITY_DN19931_c0_g1_i1:201-515(+)